MIAEACTHHAMADDYRAGQTAPLAAEYTGKGLTLVAAGPALKRDLRQYDMVIQCGMILTPTVYQNRVREANSLGVAISNYGLVISYIQGVLPRIISPFPELRDLSRELTGIGL